MSYQVCDSREEPVGIRETVADARALVRLEKLDGHSIWSGQVVDGEFEADQRIEFAHETSDDPRIREALGQSIPEDTECLPAPHWTFK